MVDKIDIKWKRLREDAEAPTYAHPFDAGMDLYAAMPGAIAPGETLSVSTGIAVAIPEGYVGLIHPRSGLAAKYGMTVLNAPGTVDAGYRGEVRVLLYNAGASLFKIAVGSRIAQLVVQQVAQVSLIETDSLDDTVRNVGGFGSSGE